MIATLRSWFRRVIEPFEEEPKRLIYLALLGFLSVWVLRGCNTGKSLPSEVTAQVERMYITCINPDDTPIQVGVNRQPDCGKVYINMTAQGIVPALEQANGIKQAICYQVTVEYPRWQTMGQTRHEVLWSERSYSKVALLEMDHWRTFPDVDREDEGRWHQYGCPGAYLGEQ